MNKAYRVNNYPEILLPDRPIAFNRDFVRLGIKVNGALFLSQALYWSKRTKDEDGWFYKTVEDWVEETGLSVKEQETVKKSLLEKGYIEIVKRGLPARNYFKVNAYNLAQDLAEDDIPVTPKQVDQSPRNGGTSHPLLVEHSISESTTEITQSVFSEKNTVCSFEEFCEGQGFEHVDGCYFDENHNDDPGFLHSSRKRPFTVEEVKEKYKKYVKNLENPQKGYEKPVFNYQEELEKLRDSGHKTNKILALIWLNKGYHFENALQMNAQYSIDSVYAAKLKGYSGSQITEAIKLCVADAEERGYDWKASTVVKKITEIKNDTTND